MNKKTSTKLAGHEIKLSQYWHVQMALLRDLKLGVLVIDKKLPLSIEIFCSLLLKQHESLNEEKVDLL